MANERQTERPRIHRIERWEALPAWTSPAALARFFHTTMKPYEDSVEDIERALAYAFGGEPGKGGFLLLAERASAPIGALLMLNTGMSGYVPEHLLVFIGVAATARGEGLGRRLVEEACRGVEGAVKLHVEYDNPARRLYERLGFKSKYAEMRYEP